MKKSMKISLCGILAALSIVTMFLAGIVPTMTIALPAIAGCMLIPVTAECGTKYGLTVFAVVSVLGFFVVSDREAWLMYVLFFGYFPAVYGVFDKIKHKRLRFIVKIVLFTIATVAEGLIATFILGIPLDSMGELGKWSVIILLVMAEIVFIVYNKAVRNLIALYFLRFRKVLLKILGGRM